MRGRPRPRLTGKVGTVGSAGGIDAAVVRDGPLSGVTEGEGELGARVLLLVLWMMPLAASGLVVLVFVGADMLLLEWFPGVGCGACEEEASKTARVCAAVPGDAVGGLMMRPKRVWLTGVAGINIWFILMNCWSSSGLTLVKKLSRSASRAGCNRERTRWLGEHVLGWGPVDSSRCGLMWCTPATRPRCSLKGTQGPQGVKEEKLMERCAVSRCKLQHASNVNNIMTTYLPPSQSRPRNIQSDLIPLASLFNSPTATPR